MNRIELLESIDALLSLPRDSRGRISRELLEAWERGQQVGTTKGGQPIYRWHDGGKTRTQASEPGTGRGKKKEDNSQKSSEKPDSQPAKPSKSVKSTGDISSAVELFKSIQSSGTLDADAVSKISAALSTLTIPKIKDLKKQLGIGGSTSGKKADLIKRISDAAVSAVKSGEASKPSDGLDEHIKALESNKEVALKAIAKLKAGDVKAIAERVHGEKFKTKDAALKALQGRDTQNESIESLLGRIPESAAFDGFDGSEVNSLVDNYQFSPSELKAIDHYTGESGTDTYREINKHLRLGTPITPEGKETIRQLDQVMLREGKFPSPVAVYRVITLSNNDAKALAKEIYQSYKNKSPLHWKAYSSTTLDEQLACDILKSPEDFGMDSHDAGFMFQIKAIKGLRIKSASEDIGDEGEVLLPRNSNFKVLGVVKDSDGLMRIQLEQVLQGGDGKEEKPTKSQLPPLGYSGKENTPLSNLSRFQAITPISIPLKQSYSMADLPDKPSSKFDSGSDRNLNEKTEKYLMLHEDNFFKSLSADEADAIEEYVYDSGYINKFTRTPDKYNESGRDRLHQSRNTGKPIKPITDIVKKLDEVIDKSPPLENPVSTYRAIDIGGKDESNYLQYLNHLYESGQPLNFLSYTSTSINPEKVKDFGSIVFEIKATKGVYVTQAFEKYYKTKSGKGQQELILPRNSQFRVVGFDKNGKIGGDQVTIIQLEQIWEPNNQNYQSSEKDSLKIQQTTQFSPSGSKSLNLSNPVTRSPKKTTVQPAKNNHKSQSAKSQHLTESGFTGTITDRLNRKRKYVDGKPVKGGAASTTGAQAKKKAKRQQPLPPVEKHTIISRLKSLASGAKSLAKNVAARIGNAAWSQLTEKEKQVAESTWTIAKGVYVALESPRHHLETLAKNVAKERGLDDKQVKQVSSVLATASIIEQWGTNIPLAHHGLHELHIDGFAGFALAKVGAFIPIAALGYLAYSFGRNPFATLSAARKMIKDHSGKVHESESETDIKDLTGMLLERKLDDQYFAVLMAALDKTKSLKQAIIMADEVTHGT